MNSRVFALLALAGLAACDPTGNTDFSRPSANIRLANFVVDAPALSMTANGSAVHSGIGFGLLSAYQRLGVDDTVLVFTRSGDGIVAGTDSVLLVEDRRYSYYGLGTVAAYKPRLLVDDTLFAAAGGIKVRIIHGIGTRSTNELDFYASLPSDSLIDIAPLMPSLAYGAASPYLTADATFRRFRLTIAGLTTAILDTTLATAIADSSVVTLVASDTAGGGTPFRMVVVIDKAP